MNLVNYGTIVVEEIPINEYELSKRLSTEKGFRTDEIEQNIKRLKEVIDCRYAFAKMPVTKGENGVIDCGFGEFKSVDLCKNLKESQEVFLFATTLGIGVDRLLNKLSALSTADYFMTDAIASAMAEGAMNKVDKIIRNDFLCRPRFSPGFGDLSLEVQPKLLDLLNAQKMLGIIVGKSYLMTPMKSVTAIMGIVNKP